MYMSLNLAIEVPKYSKARNAVMYNNKIPTVENPKL